MRVHLGVKSDVGEKVLGARDVSSKCSNRNPNSQHTSCILPARPSPVVSICWASPAHYVRSVLIQADVVFPLAIL
jgi:hypothetical protein